MKRPNIEQTIRLREIPESTAGHLAIHPDYGNAEAIVKIGGRAGVFYGDPDDDEPTLYQLEDDAAFVTIDGLLLMRGGWYYDGHEAIASRCLAALKDDRVKRLGLRIHSPGGVVAGNIEAVNTVRAFAASVGKPIFAHAKAMAFSAAYAWACAASKVYLSPSAGMGSIGVISGITSFAGMNEQNGISTAIIASGDRKTDGNSDLPIDPQAVLEMRKTVDYLADLFATLVSVARKMSVADIRAQQAACFYGPDAVGSGLADGVLSEDEFMGLMGRGNGDQTMTNKGALGDAGTGQDFGTALAAAITETATARTERDTFKTAAEEAKSGEKKARTALAELSRNFAAYVGAEAKLAGKGTVEGIDKMLASMVDDSGVPRALVIAEHFASIPRGAALPKETKEPGEGPEAKGPSAKKAAEGLATLDGSKMSLTAISTHASDAPTFDRLMAQHTATVPGGVVRTMFPTLGR